MGCRHCTLAEPACERERGFAVYNVDGVTETLGPGIVDVTPAEILYTPAGNEDCLCWALDCLRRYGFDADLFSFETGRRCATGPGVYAFKCKQARQLYNALQESIQKAGRVGNQDGCTDSHDKQAVASVKRNEISAVSYVKSCGNSPPLPIATRWSHGGEGRSCVTDAIYLYSALLVPHSCAAHRRAEPAATATLTVSSTSTATLTVSSTSAATLTVSSASAATHDYVNTMCESPGNGRERPRAGCESPELARRNPKRRSRSTGSTGTSSWANSPVLVHQSAVTKLLPSDSDRCAVRRQTSCEPPVRSLLSKMLRRYKSETDSLESSDVVARSDMLASPGRVRKGCSMGHILESDETPAEVRHFAASAAQALRLDVGTPQRKSAGRATSTLKCNERTRKTSPAPSPCKSALDTEHCYVNLTVGSEQQKTTTTPTMTTRRSAIDDASFDVGRSGAANGRGGSDSRVNYIMLDLSEKSSCACAGEHVATKASSASPTRAKRQSVTAKSLEGYAQIDFDKTAALSRSISRRDDEYGSRKTRHCSEVEQ
ncbi:PREDICTED: fibroblast growth factor receptor substrate 3-like [Priapulus caudatus]|uniref:Fibroblast growth factor receptor substrate 3-like n=1 Tax=Priapulus caudatus TaxID=37621 RepID=A0ABM1F054_PRICU|nr:PREDICTED: fibroblast growth factor receptor substrate 3-like [Priapulus caudatus]